ncbi:MAG: hypothetical protein HY725_14945 [Candidatus Rokubacteria bacterium]|nr:hypothetical protein [Candidatus Rokubacteria bacterium]
MRRYWVVALAVLTLLGVLSPPVFAQAPKVTITGFIDNVVNYSRNMSQFDNPASIATNVRGGITNPSDDEMVARTRGRFDIIGEVGKAKGVLGLEIDLNYGQVGGADNADGHAIQRFGTSGGLDANTDIRSVIEIKWMYVDFPFSGPGSLLPFIPLPGSLTVGGQPYGLGLKPSILADSDFGGATLRMTVSPTLKGSFTLATFEEDSVGHQNFNGTAVPPAGTPPFGRGDDWGLILKPDWQATKELRVSPIYAFQMIQGTTSVVLRRAIGGYGVGSANFSPDLSAASVVTACRGTAAANVPCQTQEENRHWIGFDARWAQGPLYVAPTFFYQWGDRERFESAGEPGANSAALRRRSADINAWILDVEAGYRVGPLLLQARAMYTSGNKASDNLNEEIHYYQPFQVDSTYYFGWGETVPLSSIDYFQGLYTTVAGLFEGTNIGYDRYGRSQFSVKGTYDLTPAFSVYGIITPMWTARAVPTNNGVVTTGGILCIDNPGTAPVAHTCTRRDDGDDSYLGTDLALGFTWKFAPGLTFDWIYGLLVPGGAYDNVRDVCISSTATGICGGIGVLDKREAQNVYTTSARVRYSW